MSIIMHQMFETTIDLIYSGELLKLDSARIGYFILLRYSKYKSTLFRWPSNALYRYGYRYIYIDGFVIWYVSVLTNSNLY